MFSLIWANFIYRKLQNTVMILGVSISMALIVGIMLFKNEIQQRFEENAIGIDLVAGAKGSPLQLVLNSIFQMDVPVGNIPFKFYREMREEKRVKTAIPVCLGDNIKGFRVVGTTTEYFKYLQPNPGQSLVFDQGQEFGGIYEAVLGAEAAKVLNYKVGQKFVVTHGVQEDTNSSEHGDAPFTVVGSLRKTGTPIDRVIFTNCESVVDIHKAPEERRSTIIMSDDDMVTAVLIRLQSPLAGFRFQREINDGKIAQAAFPVVEIRKLFDIVGNINNVMLVICWVVVMMSVLGILLNILGSLTDRRREMALLRALGFSRPQLLFTFVGEMTMVLIAGVVGGLIFGHLAYFIIGNVVGSTLGVVLHPGAFGAMELVVAGVILFFGIVMSLLPGLILYRVDVSSQLS